MQNPKTILGKITYWNRYFIKCTQKRKGKGSRVQADMSKLPIKNESVDAVITVAALEHVNRPINVLKEIVRVLKPGGIVIHKDAWNVPIWRPLALQVKSYSEISLRYKILKFFLPLLETFPMRIIRILPLRFFREIKFRFGYFCFDFKLLKPNYEAPTASDADACVSVDSHTVGLFYKKCGFKLIKPKDKILSRISHRGILILKKKSS